MGVESGGIHVSVVGRAGGGHVVLPGVRGGRGGGLVMMVGQKRRLSTVRVVSGRRGRLVRRVKVVVSEGGLTQGGQRGDLLRMKLLLVLLFVRDVPETGRQIPLGHGNAV